MAYWSFGSKDRPNSIAKAVRRARWRITWKRRWQTDIYNGHKNYLFNVHNAKDYYLLSLSRRRRIERVDTDGNHTVVHLSMLSSEILNLIEKVLKELPR